MSEKSNPKKLEEELLKIIDTPEIQKDNSIKEKKELEEDIEQAIISQELDENLLEGIIKEESKILNVIEQQNSKLLDEIDEKIGDYSKEKKVKEGYLTNFEEDERKYNPSNSNLIELENEKFVRFKEQEKKKDERKYLSFKQSY